MNRKLAVFCLYFSLPLGGWAAVKQAPVAESAAAARKAPVPVGSLELGTRNAAPVVSLDASLGAQNANLFNLATIRAEKAQAAEASRQNEPEAAVSKTVGRAQAVVGSLQRSPAAELAKPANGGRFQALLSRVFDRSQGASDAAAAEGSYSEALRPVLLKSGPKTEKHSNEVPAASSFGQSGLLAGFAPLLGAVSLTLSFDPMGAGIGAAVGFFLGILLARRTYKAPEIKVPHGSSTISAGLEILAAVAASIREDFRRIGRGSVFAVVGAIVSALVGGFLVGPFFH